MPHGLCGFCWHASVAGRKHDRCSGDDCRCSECILSTVGISASADSNRHLATIDWQLIAKAVSFYTSIGYCYVEVPWIVTQAAINATLPPGKTGLLTQDGPLVGSAEQSFIQFMLDGQLSPGRYVAATPCFRDDTVDELHQRTFFKVELINVLQATEQAVDLLLSQVVDAALDFFQQIAPQGSLLAPETPDGFDIELGGVEIGSYGYRRRGKHRWMYGTGLAEPRFSVAARRFATSARR